MPAVLDAPADLATLSDDELTAMYATADDATIAALTAECNRRDRATRIAAARKRAAEKRQALYAEWREWAHADYLAAEARCAGNLLSREGGKHCEEPMRLWSLPEHTARLWASEELNAHWDEADGHMTFARYLRQRATSRRIDRDQHAMELPGSGRNGAGPATGTTLPHGSTIPRNRPVMQAKQAAAGSRMRGNMDVTDQAPPVLAPGELAARSAARKTRLNDARDRMGIPRSDATVAVRPQSTALASPPIDGARVLNQAYGYLGHMAYWPSDAAQITATLYAAMAHARDEKTKLPVVPYVPRLFLTSKEGGSGKSRIARITGALCPDPKRLAEMTKASLIDLIAARNTVIITEFDTLVGATGKRTPWLAGLVNVGYEDDGTTARKQGGVPVEIPLCGPLIGDGLKSVFESSGEVFKTMKSRCIIVEVFRAPEGYRAPKYRREAKATAQAIQGRLARWMAQEVRNGIGEAEPELPEHLGNRPADLWEPLFSVAEAAGEQWPDLARFACERIETAAGRPGEEEVIADQVDATLESWGAQGPSVPVMVPADNMDGDEFE